MKSNAEGNRGKRAEAAVGAELPLRFAAHGLDA